MNNKRIKRIIRNSKIVNQKLNDSRAALLRQGFGGQAWGKVLRESYKSCHP